MNDVLFFFSRYRPRFVRSLVYMLQASEYDVAEYLRWYHRTRDFAHVEHRKQLQKTPKALALLALAWALLVVWVVAVMAYVASTGSDVPLVVGALVVVATPFYFPYLLAAVVVLMRAVQWPVEYVLMQRAKKTLARHRGLKIAIAGSFGKTSMREILKTVLAEGKKVAAPPGSYNTPLGIAQFVRTLKGDEDVIIFELGEYYPGDIRKLCRIVQPQWGVITGVNEAHLEKFGSLDATANTIFELTEFVAPEQLYINGENALARARAKSGNVIYSRAGAGRFSVENSTTNLDGAAFVLAGEGLHINAHSHLLGLHQIGPLVAVGDIALRLGISPEQLERGIAHTKPFAHRLEPKTDASGVITLDDSYNGNPDGVAAVIEFLASLKDHRRWYVTPGLVEMGVKKEAVHREIGRHLARAGIEKIVLMRNSVTPYIEAGLKEAAYTGDIIWFDDALTGLAALSHMTAKGDIVLLQNDWPDQYA
jgi:UDP-N-acetylmuramoyl-tripeptide--D-alanyl-D-alanine ligase